ncbi:MAG: hypothetical protein R3B09_23890 [Nannocystaceae bacterium]
MSAEDDIAALMDYLRALAPSFFAARMRGAADAEIERFERAAGERLSDGHREFLRHAGSTPPQALNPFLYDRDYCVDTLVAEYDGWRAAGQAFPPGIVYFSSSEITGETLFLRRGESLADDPEIGDLLDDGATFRRNARVSLVSYLRWFAFIFRCGQLAHGLDICPRWDRENQRWLGDRAAMRDILGRLGFTTRFELGDGCEQLDGDRSAATLESDGSATIFSDDGAALRRFAAALQVELDLGVTRIAASARLLAPRE